MGNMFCKSTGQLPMLFCIPICKEYPSTKCEHSIEATVKEIPAALEVFAESKSLTFFQPHQLMLVKEMTGSVFLK